MHIHTHLRMHERHARTHARKYQLATTNTPPTYCISVVTSWPMQLFRRNAICQASCRHTSAHVRVANYVIITRCAAGLNRATLFVNMRGGTAPTNVCRCLGFLKYIYSFEYTSNTFC